jgi:hypothetical protein
MKEILLLPFTDRKKNKAERRKVIHEHHTVEV